MSLRDEIAKTAAETMDAWHVMASCDEPAATVEQWIADALMPLVERAVRESALQMAGLCVAEFAPTTEMPSTMLIERANAIVARVLK